MSNLNTSPYEIDDLPTFGDERRIIYHYNPDSSKDIAADGGNLFNGGFGSDVSGGGYAFGPVAEVPHGDRKSQEYVAKTLKNVAILGWESYWMAENWPKGVKRPAGQRIFSARLKRWHRTNAPEWSASSRMNYYIVFLDDPKLAIHSVSVSGTRTQKGYEQIADGMPAVQARAAKLLGIKQTAPCAVICNIGVSKPIAVGSGTDTGKIAPPFLDVVKLSDDELLRRIVSPEMYSRLVDLSRQVKAQVDQNECEARSFGEIVQLASGVIDSTPALPEPDMASDPF